MIEQLKNCPNCGGTLNEAGRCSFCGSKVFDFLSINFDHTYRPSAKTYIRIRSGGRTIIAPVIVEAVDVTLRQNGVTFSTFEGNKYVAETSYYPEFNVTFLGIGETIEIDDTQKGEAE